MLISETGAAVAFSLTRLSSCQEIENLATLAGVRLTVLVIDMSLVRVEGL